MSCAEGTFSWATSDASARAPRSLKKFRRGRLCFRFPVCPHPVSGIPRLPDGALWDAGCTVWDSWADFHTKGRPALRIWL